MNYILPIELYARTFSQAASECTDSSHQESAARMERALQLLFICASNWCKLFDP